jgi:hypothetical protein
MKIKLYHGSPVIVRKPQFGVGKAYNDYGQGFYCAESLDLAKEWSVDEGRDGFANVYSLETDGLNVVHLNEKPFCIMHWLSVLLLHREFELDTDLAAEAREYILSRFPVDLSDADAVIGYRADDSYFTFARNFLNGAITLTKLSEAMHLGKLGLQFMLKSERAFGRIVFEEAIPAAASEWYPLKKGRDDEARRSYREIRGRRERNGLYITRILEEEMTVDDLRL